MSANLSQSSDSTFVKFSVMVETWTWVTPMQDKKSYRIFKKNTT